VCILHFLGFATMCYVVAVDDKRIGSGAVWARGHVCAAVEGGIGWVPVVLMTKRSRDSGRLGNTIDIPLRMSAIGKVCNRWQVVGTGEGGVGCDCSTMDLKGRCAA